MKHETTNHFLSFPKTHRCFHKLQFAHASFRPPQFWVLSFKLYASHAEAVENHQQ